MTDKQRRSEPDEETDPPGAATAGDVGEPRIPLGQWLVENMPRGTDLEVPDRRESNRKIPFIDDEEWA